MGRKNKPREWPPCLSPRKHDTFATIPTEMRRSPAMSILLRKSPKGVSLYWFAQEQWYRAKKHAERVARGQEPKDGDKYPSDNSFAKDTGIDGECFYLNAALVVGAERIFGSPKAAGNARNVLVKLGFLEYVGNVRGSDTLSRHVYRMSDAWSHLTREEIEKLYPSHTK